MARGNKYTCRVCGKVYDYCPSCALIPNPIMEDGFCCKEHYEIFATLSKHGCGKATAEETAKALDKLTVPAELTPSIKAHIDAIHAEVKSVEVKETPVEGKTFFNKK